MSKLLKLLTLSFVTLALVVPPVQACPFCSAVSQTISEEIASADAVAIVRLLEAAPISKTAPTGADVPKATFQIETVIKGQSHLDGKQIVQTLYFGDAKKGQTFFVTAVEPPKLVWSTPTPLSARAVKYIQQLSSLPKDGPDRLFYFQNHLEDEDELLARDAYDEFAKASYKDVRGLKPRMKHDQLIGWIKNPEVPASRRRLYLTMLGVCGTNEDAPLLESMLRSTDRKQKAGLDAMIACYLTLRGSDGMPLVEDLFLKNRKAEYADTYSAIMALRFHGTETDIVPRKRILEGLHYMLDRPDLADLVIPDLARWEDWSQMGRLVELFKTADDKSNWVKTPVVNFLRVCPLPEAKEALKELEKIDPQAVKRANTPFPFGSGAGTSGKTS